MSSLSENITLILPPEYKLFPFQEQILRELENCRQHYENCYRKSCPDISPELRELQRIRERFQRARPFIGDLFPSLQSRNSTPITTNEPASIIEGEPEDWK